MTGYPSLWALEAFHVLFYAVFVPRWVQSWRRPAAGGGRMGPQLPLLVHGAALGILYLGLFNACLIPPTAAASGNALVRIASRRLLAPQQVAGGCVMLAATALAAWTLWVFRSWRLAAHLDPGHELCTAGPFRWVRHPIYLAMDLLALGSWLWAPTALVGGAVVLVAVGGDWRARSEERLLLGAFGEGYERLQRRVRRFIPGVY
jgi:protein-S-isoprenylcysteine O-methyltransferase Ste14